MNYAITTLQYKYFPSSIDPRCTSYLIKHTWSGSHVNAAQSPLLMQENPQSRIFDAFLLCLSSSAKRSYLACIATETIAPKYEDKIAIFTFTSSCTTIRRPLVSNIRLESSVIFSIRNRIHYSRVHCKMNNVLSVKKPSFQH